MPPATRRRSIWLPSLGGLISEVVEGQNLATHFTTISLALAKMRNPSLGKLGGLGKTGASISGRHCASEMHPSDCG